MSLLGNLLFFNLAILTVLLVGLGFAVPRRLRRIAVQNCFRRNGTFSRNRYRREVRHAGKFATSLTVALFPLIVGVNSTIVLVHTLVIPLPSVFEFFENFDPNRITWEDKVEHSPRGDLVSDNEEFMSAQGWNREQIRRVQTGLWEGWPLLAALALMGCVFAGRYVARVFIAAMEEYVPKLLDRRFGYYALDATFSQQS